MTQIGQSVTEIWHSEVRQDNWSGEIIALRSAPTACTATRASRWCADVHHFLSGSSGVCPLGRSESSSPQTRAKLARIQLGAKVVRNQLERGQIWFISIRLGPKWGHIDLRSETLCSPSSGMRIEQCRIGDGTVGRWRAGRHSPGHAGTSRGQGFGVVAQSQTFQSRSPHGWMCQSLQTSQPGRLQSKGRHKTTL